MKREEKEWWIKLISTNLTTAELDSMANATKGRGIRKTFVAKGHWRCIMDVIKSKLTGSGRASDIALPQIMLMNGLMNGIVYDWAALIAKRMYEFLTLQHRTFYMPHYVIGLFLEATREAMPKEELEVRPQGPLAAGEPPIMYWKHLDIGHSSAKRKLAVDTTSPSGEPDNGRDSSSTDDSKAEDEEDDGNRATEELVRVMFAPPLLPMGTLVPSSRVGSTCISAFGQSHTRLRLAPSRTK